MKRHNKRYGAPTKKWGMPIKEGFWAPRISSGAHPKDRSVPLVVILRDVLKYTNSAREARIIIGERKVHVDGEPETDHKAPVGLMDIVSLVDLDEHYRVLFDQKGKIKLLPVEEDEQHWKLCKIIGKTTLKNGVTQYNLHDGRNFQDQDSGKYSTKDVLKISIPEQKVMVHYEFTEGSMAMITGGRHIGEIGTIKEYEVVKGPQPNLVHFESDKSTVEEYVFIVGTDKPVIKIPEVGII
ncbi:MAG: 30S ribosomal protein S4e [Thermoplasmatota archaeon]